MWGEAAKPRFEQAGGVPRTEEEFVDAAVKAGHPRNFQDVLPEVLQKAVHMQETLDDQALAKMRTCWIAKWAKRAEQLTHQEAELKRTFDLKTAYRQLAIAPESSWASYVACWDAAAAAPKIFRMRALPFGASRAVYSFLRIVMAVWFIAADQLAIPWTTFFDDFITFSRKAGSKHLQRTIEAFFKLLGWSFAEDGDKACPFALDFQALGIKISLSRFTDGTVFFCNTERRVLELKQTLQQVLDSGFLPQALALKLRGRMQFADGQLFGRTGRACMQAVTSHAWGDNGPELSQPARLAIKKFMSRLCADAPRVISVMSQAPWFVFTDACYEAGHASWPCGLGGVLFDQLGSAVDFFSVGLGAEERRLLGEGRSSQIIFEAELMALVVALRKWGPLLCTRLVMCYVDNNATRDVAISATARTAVPSALVEMLVTNEECMGFYPWYARVPSPSNVADRPSRELLNSFVWKGVSLPNSSVETELRECFDQLRQLTVK
ncbi:unnamed protein product [Symbiodinium sp. CCMP2592]|nr:unnamed protein product [Symbiodinium sp. CCMP2592]